MKGVLGLINIDGKEHLEQLTSHRPVAALPFGGRYRIIDFVLSNMVNSGIENVGVFTQNNCRSLMDHLRYTKDWDLHRRKGGLFILPPDSSKYPAGIYRGDLEKYSSHMDYVENSKKDYVLVCGSNMICSINYNNAFRFHQETGADITLLYKQLDNEIDAVSGETAIKTMPDGRVTEIVVDADNKPGAKVLMESYILSTKLFLEIVKTNMTMGNVSLLTDGLIKNLSALKVYAYPHRGYLGQVNSVLSYYRHNFDLLQPDIWNELFFSWKPIHTKVKNEPPTKYKTSGLVKNSLVASGCIIEGRVENSILFRKVRVGRGAYIKDSIVLPKSEIEAEAALENVILDKRVNITSGKSLRGEVNYPIIVGKNTTV